jgi:hypothetical protein
MAVDHNINLFHDLSIILCAFTVLDVRNKTINKTGTVLSLKKLTICSRPTQVSKKLYAEDGRILGAGRTHRKET